MNKIKTAITQWERQLEGRWGQLPQKRQRSIVFYCFIGYLLNTIVVITQIGYEAAQPGSAIPGKHINNLPLQQDKSIARGLDSIPSLLKENTNER
jgi:hypothetical protein